MIRERAKLAVVWLGLASLGFWLLLALDMVARERDALAPRTLLYLAALSLAASACASVPVALAHLTRLLPPRWRRRAVLGVFVVVGVAVLPAIDELSRFLVAGAWVSALPFVTALRFALAAVALVCVELLLLWHAYGTSAELRAAIARRTSTKLGRFLAGAFWFSGVGALLIVFATIGELLRPYALLATQLLIPCWLIAATLAFRLTGARARVALPLAGTMLGLGLAGVVAAWIDPVGHLPIGSAVFETQSFGSLTEAWFAHEHPIAQFDFAAATGKACPKPRRERRLALSPEQRRNVILISMDTLRRDVLGKRVGGRAIAPNVEAFERECLSFTRAATPASFTIAAVGSAFSGRSVSQLMWLSRIPQNIFTRPRKPFQRAQVIVPDWNFLKRPSFRQLVLQGVPTRYVPRKDDPGQLFIDHLKRARERGERGLFWLHVVDPHAPYNPHPETSFGNDRISLYYGEIAFDDAILGRVFDYLRGSGYYEDSLIIFFSDHGESLGEKGGYFGHGISNAGRLGDVPLFVHYPQLQPHRSTAAVSLTSIAPTIWHYLDQPIPGAVDACSLLLPDSALAKCPHPVTALFGSGLEVFEKIVKRPLRTRADLEARQRSMRRWQRFPPELTAVSSEHRYLRNMQTGIEHVYRRTLFDPGEKHDLIAEHPELLRAFRADVARWQRAEAERLVCQLGE